LGLDLYTSQNQTQYALGSPIGVSIVVKNVSGFPTNTDRGFSEIDLYNSLILTDPSGTAFKYSEQERALDHPPPFFLEGRAAVPAETLPSTWVRTTTIDDLTNLFTMMKTNPGWYTLEAQLPFTRFTWIVNDSQLGLLGISGHPDQCEGFLVSNQLKFYVSPASGAQLQINVLDRSSGTPAGINQVPVKVFEGVIPLSALKDAWEKGAPVLAGTTNSEGLAVWAGGGNCKPRNDYTAIAYHQNGFKSVGFETNPPTGPDWAPGCGSTIAREIVFDGFPALSAFSVLGINSVWLTASSIVKTGNVGVLNASQGLWLDSRVEISVGLGARAENGVKIYGDSIKLLRNASVDSVYYNDLQNAGTIRGEAVKPLTLPLPLQLPPFLQSTPGTSDVTVKDGATKTLAAGKYRDVKLGKNSVLKLSGGTYHFRKLDIGDKSSVTCVAASEVRIKDRLYPGTNAKINAQGSAKNLKIYIEGANGSILNLLALPKAAEIGPGNVVKANIYVPNGTLWVNLGSDITGSFIAKGIILGVNAKVSLDSAF